jgi:hypothetical protein
MMKDGVRYAEVGDIWQYCDGHGIAIQTYLVHKVLKQPDWMECGRYSLLRLDVSGGVKVHEVQLCERYALSGWRFIA